MRNAIIILVILMFNTISCMRDKNTVDSSPINEGNGKLSMKTDKDIYSWQQGESELIIIVQGTLENRAESTYYSKIGDGFGPSEQDQLFIAENSSGRIEKYNKSDNSWYEINIAGLLIEGSRFVPLKPSNVYSIYAYLYINKNNEEKGKYRLRIAYYGNSNPGDDETPFRDYSNSFEIM
jgi:hypothetical protein